MAAIKIRDLIFKNYQRRTGFFTENSDYSMKHQKKKIYNAK